MPRLVEGFWAFCACIATTTLPKTPLFPACKAYHEQLCSNSTQEDSPKIHSLTEHNPQPSPLAGSQPHPPQPWQPNNANSSNN